MFPDLFLNSFVMQWVFPLHIARLLSVLTLLPFSFQLQVHLFSGSG